MASLIHAEKYFLVISGNSIAQYTTTDGSVSVVDISEGDNLKSEDKSEKKEHLTRKEKDAGEGTYHILACKLSHSQKYLAVTTDNKQLLLYKMDPQCRQLSRRSVARRVNCLCFDHAENFVLCGDKSGDVFRYPITEPEKSGEIIMGHLSMLLDMVISAKDEFILTCDRDEKIRVSRYPNAYNIHTFCLGHSEFVTGLCLLDGFDDLMVSGSGDASVRLWNLREGHLLSTIDCKSQINSENLQRNLAVHRLCYHSASRNLAVSFDKQKTILILKDEGGDSHPKFSVVQQLTTSGPVLDLLFDTEGNLLVLQNFQNDSLSVFSKNESGDYVISKPDVYSSSIECVNSNWKYFEDSLNVESPYANLYRVKIDNMKDYLEKKQKRIDATTGKAAVAEKEPPQKKSKVGAAS